jgi:hypothetical protein
MKKETKASPPLVDRGMKTISCYFKPLTIKSISDPLKTFRKHNLVEELSSIKVSNDEREISASIKMLPEKTILLNVRDEQYIFDLYFSDRQVKDCVKAYNEFMQHGDAELIKLSYQY